MKRLVSLAAITAGLTAPGLSSAFAADVDVPRTITSDTTWTADNTYFLTGYTFVVSPAVLTIEPGTVIKGRPKGGGSEAAALVITRGAQINANGNAAQPIIFTAEEDDLAGNLGPDDTNLWGGLVILGDATINSRANGQPAGTPAQDQVEGFSVTGGEVDYITFGGTDDEDNSGTLRYVSIRHGGEPIGTANEINGLTLGGVGRGTTIEYIEVFANKDDGVEFFGGTVDLRYAVTAFGKDDGYDYDQGWRGRGQFWFTLGGASTEESADKGGEWDGATSPVDATPIGGTSVYNATFIGNGAGGINNTALNIRDNAIAKVYNSIFTEYNNMLDLEADNQVRFDAGDVDFENNIWWSHVTANNNAGAFDIGAINAESFWTDVGNNNTIENPMLRGISRVDNRGLDPRPAEGSPALVGPFATVPDDDWYVQTNYKGAFAPEGPTWLQGWTKLSRDGYLKKVLGGSADAEFINISTRANVGTGDNVAIAGFIISGSGPKQVLIRLVGKPLEAAPFNLSGVLQDPSIDLYAGSSVIESNDNWGDNDNAGELDAVSIELGLGLHPIDPNDAALLVTLNPGSYTVIGRGVSSGTGIAVLEVYEVD